MTKMKKLLLTLILGMFMLMSVSALDNQGVGKQYQNFTIVQTCSDSTYITLSTIQLPDKTIKIINSNMTSIGGGAYAYNLTDTSQIGRYDITGISDGCENTFATYFEITPNGFIGTTSFYILFIVLASLLIILGLSIKDPYTTIFGSFIMVFFGLYVLFYGITGMKDTVYTWGIGLITLMFGAYLGIRAGIETID